MATVETTPRNATIEASDGLRLAARYWPRVEARGVLVVIHGFGEHGGCYTHVAERLGPAAGVDVVAPDLRGHGRSPGPRGVVKHYDELTRDLTDALAWVGRERPGLPVFLLGHSNGGQVAIRAALDSEAGRGIAGMILSNPSIRLAFRVPRIQLALGRLLHRIAPSVTLPAPIEVKKLSHDPSMRDFYLNDPLRHGRISAPLFFGMIDGGEALLDRVQSLTLPLLMLLSGADPVVDPAAGRLAFDRFGSPDKTLREFPELLHEPLNDLGRDELLADVGAWLGRHLPPRD